MGFKHPIRDIFLVWVGKRFWNRHEAKKEQRGNSSQPYQQSKTQDSENNIR